MTATAKDLRFNISFLFSALSKGEDITITNRGKPTAKLTSIIPDESNTKDDLLFGMWNDRNDNVDSMVRNTRKKREF
ncbi:MAG: hypothetical protein RL154_128 [Pseudomonadota bacterium]|jgi:prevent-host-death family protein